MLLGFKAGIPGALGKEVLEGRLLMAQALLQRHRTDLGQKRCIRVLFQRWSKGTGVVIADLFLALIERIGAIAKHRVPYKPHTPECPRQQGFLLRRWIETVFESAFGHHDLHDSAIVVKFKRKNVTRWATRLYPLPSRFRKGFYALLDKRERSLSVPGFMTQALDISFLQTRS